MADYLLTTIDNPYNPFTQWIDWLNFDMVHGYNTCGRIARLTDNISLMTDEQIDDDTENAMDTIILTDPTGIYRKVTKYDTFGVEETKKMENELESTDKKITDSFK